MKNKMNKVTVIIEHEMGSDILVAEFAGPVTIQENLSEVENYPFERYGIRTPTVESLDLNFNVYKDDDGVVYTIKNLDKDGNPRGH